jgi:hypothetical protein
MMRVKLFTTYEGIKAYNDNKRFKACSDKVPRKSGDGYKKSDFIYEIYVRAAEIRSEEEFGFVTVKRYSFAK